MHRMARIDGCPQCVVNAETPRTVTDQRGGFRADYRCSDCGHEWYTSWEER